MAFHLADRRPRGETRRSPVETRREWPIASLGKDAIGLVDGGKVVSIHGIKNKIN
jgi:hypothetical protein